MKIKKCFACLFLLLICSGFLEEQVWAAQTVFESKDCQMVYFQDGSSLTVESKEDVLVITGEHVKSAASISYETAGYTMTMQKTEGMVEQYDYQPVTLISKEEEITDVVTTSYYLDRKSILEGAYQIYRRQYGALTEAKTRQKFLEELHQNGGLDFYLHNVFRVIERSGGSGSAVINRSRAYLNLGTPVGSTPKTEGILNAVYDLYQCEWSEATKQKLSEYYDIHLKLYFEQSETNIVLADKEGNILKYLLRDFPLVRGADMSYELSESEKEAFSVGDVKYQLTEESLRKSYLCYGNSKDPVQTYDLYSEDGIKIRLLTGKVEYRQLYIPASTLYLVCEKLQAEEEVGGTEETSGQEQITIEKMSAAETAELSLCAWAPQGELFAPEQAGGAIPVNEYLYLKGQAPSWLLQAEFVWKNGEVTFPVKVSRTYVLSWTEQTGTKDGKPVYESFQMEKTVAQYVPVTRRFGYAVVSELDYYGLQEVQVTNGALADGKKVWEASEVQKETVASGTGNLGNVDLGSGIPELYFESSTDREAHLEYPEEKELGIELETRYLVGNGAIPQLPEEDFAAEAEARTGEFRVRDDVFTFGGTTYLTGEFRVYEDGLKAQFTELRSIRLLEQTVRFCSEQLAIPAEVRNGSYESYGQLRYKRIASLGGGASSVRVVPVDQILPITVHTPVYCEAVVTADNEKYCQLLAPRSGYLQLMPDAQGISGDFTLHILNTGFHSSRLGYGSRDYSRSLSMAGKSYLARTAAGVLRNEVCFPFDVYLAAAESGVSAGDKLCPAGQWIAIGTQSVRFYLPEWVAEGCYEVVCRSVAVNGVGRESLTEAGANTLASRYVAVDSFQVQISGKLYGFEVYDIADYPAWQTVFRTSGAGQLKYALSQYKSGTGEDGFSEEKSYTYTVGTLDQYARSTGRRPKYTLPILAGSHPVLLEAMIKPGYTFRFRVTASGSWMQKDTSVITITPHFYYLSECGAKREEVDLYYVLSETKKRDVLVRIGSQTDQKNPVWQTAGSTFLGIPEEELKKTAALRGVSLATWREQSAVSYCYGSLQSRTAFTTLCGYERHYYFEYSLPKRIYAATKGTNVMEYASDYGIDFTESFWKKEGFLVVAFEINGVCDGVNYLSYEKMWKLEGQPCEKVDSKKQAFVLCPGDIMLFPVNSSICEDYLQGGIY